MGRNARIRQLMTSRVPGRQPDGLERHRWIPVNPIVPQGNEQECSQDPDIADESTREYQPLRVEESPKIIEASLAKVDFERLRKVNRPGWRDYCREPNPEETEKEIDRCTCYGFYQKCWADSEERWIPHIQHCETCEEWADRKCEIPGHSPKSKNSLLSDLGNRRYIAGYPITNDNERNCCEMGLCVHEFYKHQKADIPWWACIEEQCEEHQKAKVRNQLWPKLPRCAVIKTQQCPCFRNGCLCNFSEAHPFRNSLLYPSGYEGEVNELLNTINEAEKWIRETEERTQTLRMVKNIEPNVKQIDIRVKVRKATIAAIVDCGADVDYINKAWCERQKFPIRELGDGWMEGYDAKKTRTKLQDAEVKFKYQGVTQTRRFRVVQETGTDIMVLGMPWLQEMNPDVDWKERTVTLKKEASNVDEREIGTPVSRMKRVKNKNEDSNKTSHRNNEKSKGDPEEDTAETKS